MNAIRQTALLNKRELENATPPSASWHVDYRDTAWVYIGGIPLDLSEGDVITIFSQFGSPTHLNLIREKDTGKSKGFGFLKYEDQRSCDLAVDNLGGAEVLGRMLRVDHTRYKRKEGETEDTWRIERLEQAGDEENRVGKGGTETEQEGQERGKKRRKLLKEERELEAMLAIKADGEEDDPMRDYLIKEKRDEVEKARARDERRHKHKHKHHRRRRDEISEEDGERRGYHEHGYRGRSSDEDDERRSRYKRDQPRREYDGIDQETIRSRSRDREKRGKERRKARDSTSLSEDDHRQRRKDRSRSAQRKSRNK